MAKPLLKVENVVAAYDQQEILRDVSFEVGKGEIVALIGPNGAGKSTSMKTVYGFLQPKSGRIVFNGKDTKGLRPDQLTHLGMAFVHQGRQIFRGMTVRENLELGAFIRTDKEGIKKDLELTKKQLEIKDFIINLNIKADIIKLPKELTKITKFNEDKEVIISAKKGKLEIKEI